MKVVVKNVVAGRAAVVFPKIEPGLIVHMEKLTAEDYVRPEAQGWSLVFRGERIAKGLETKKAAVEFATKFLSNYY